MYLTSLHNKTVHLDRKAENGVLRAEFEPDDELEGLDVDIRPALYDKVDDCDYPSVLNFMPPDEFREVMDQPRPHITEVAVAFPHHSNYKQLHDLVMLDKSKLFMANPPEATMSDNAMTAVQKWAIELGCDPKQQILYICGKAGSGKSTVAFEDMRETQRHCTSRSRYRQSCLDFQWANYAFYVRLEFRRISGWRCVR